MNKDKSIKDLKQYNDKLKNQFEYSKIRVCSLERENEKLQQELERKDNIINKAILFIEEMSDETEDMGIYDISYKNKAFLLRWLKNKIKR